MAFDFPAIGVFDKDRRRAHIRHRRPDVPVAAHLLDSDQVHAPFVIVGGARIAQPARARTLLWPGALSSSRWRSAAVNRTAPFVTKKCRNLFVGEPLSRPFRGNLGCGYSSTRAISAARSLGAGAASTARSTPVKRPVARSPNCFGTIAKPGRRRKLAVDFGPCPKRAQTKRPDPSCAGWSWHERAGQRVYQFPDQPSGLH